MPMADSAVVFVAMLAESLGLMLPKNIDPGNIAKGSDTCPSDFRKDWGRVSLLRVEL